LFGNFEIPVKISNVMNKRELMANSFMRNFVEVEGMAEVYQSWEKRLFTTYFMKLSRFADDDIAFHYVTASPYQLYQVLHDWLQGIG
jgi:hypothetical protein